MAEGEKLKKIYFVIGENSGDKLGAALMDVLKDRPNLSFTGLAGDMMEARGLKSLFDIEEIAVMGVSAVIGRLPNILKRISQTADDIIKQNPDCVVLIDSPDFTHRVAKKIRKRAKNISIINYVCPSVWAWRPSRAEKMAAYIDHVLAILPFEVEALKRLKGPPASYVGHPLAVRIGQSAALPKPPNVPAKMLLLPGSRSGEIKRHMPILKETLAVLKARGNEFEFLMPIVPKHAQTIKDEIATWPYSIKTIEGEDEKWQSFEAADLAFASSGTVSLELAISKVPMVLFYKLDPIAKFFRFLIKGWSAALPNLIADRIIIPERLQEFAQPEAIARLLERLSKETIERRAQLEGFEDLLDRMKTPKPAAELAADVILKFLNKGK